MLNGKEYLLNIEQAEKLGLLKEKDSRIKSWEEFKEKYFGGRGYFYSPSEEAALGTLTPISMSDQLTPHEAIALAAFSKLLKLRRDWIGEWEPKNEAYAIVYWGSIILDWIDCTTEHRTLSFPTEQMAKEFLETFHDLIEEAKILI